MALITVYSFHIIIEWVFVLHLNNIFTIKCL